MKVLLIVLITAVVSSAGTFFYTTKQMAPSLYRDIIAKARSYTNAIPKMRAPASDCSSGKGSLSEKGKKKPELKEMLQQIQKSRKEKQEFLKQFEE